MGVGASLGSLKSAREGKPTQPPRARRELCDAFRELKLLPLLLLLRERLLPGSRLLRISVQPIRLSGLVRERFSERSSLVESSESNRRSELRFSCIGV